MEENRFEKFILAVEGIHKAVQKIKINEAPKFGLKGVHLFWLCELLKSDEGMTACELAESTQINRSLVSREIETLSKNDYVTILPSGKGGYNAKLVLTEKGRAAATEIEAAALAFQRRAGAGISGDDLRTFYATLEKILENLSLLALDEGASCRGDDAAGA